MRCNQLLGFGTRLIFETFLKAVLLVFEFLAWTEALCLDIFKQLSVRLWTSQNGCIVFVHRAINRAPSGDHTCVHGSSALERKCKQDGSGASNEQRPLRTEPKPHACEGVRCSTKNVSEIRTRPPQIGSAREIDGGAQSAAKDEPT